MSLETGHKSFAEQARHYFNRPHQEIPKKRIESPAAWYGKEVKNQSSLWLHRLETEDLKELETATDNLINAGIQLGQITADNFPLPCLSKKIEIWQKQIKDGIGFVVVKALPVDDWSLEQIQMAYWGIGHHLGTPGAQNPDQELLGHVTNYGETDDSPFARLYRTSSNIDFHCDAADAVGLLCLQTAKKGGQSKIVSSVTLFNDLLARQPELVPAIFRPFKMDSRGEHRHDQKPYHEIPIGCYEDGILKTFYHSEYFRSVERLDGVEISAEERSVLDFYDNRADEADVHLDMWLEKGDMQFISNHTIAHARTDYEDDPVKPRHLLRLWLSIK